MANNFEQDGEVIPLTAPYTVASGAGALVGSIFGVAQSDVTSGAVGQFAVEGVWRLKKAASQAWTQGDLVYWDNTLKQCTNDPTLGPLIGAAAADAASGAALTIGKVLLTEGPVRSVSGGVVEGTSSVPTSINTAGAVTLTAAQLLTGTIVRDPNGASRTDVLPTALLLVAAIPGAKVGMVVKTKIVNGADAAEVITLQAGAGGAYDANQQASSQVIGQNTSKELRIRLTNVTSASEAYVAYL